MKKENDNLDEGKFIVSNKHLIYLFEYNLNKNYISNINCFKFEHNLLNYELIKFNKNNILIVGTNLNIFLLDLEKLENIGEFNNIFKFHFFIVK